MAENEEKKLAKAPEKTEKPVRKDQDKPGFLARTRETVQTFYREVVGELRKVSWPTWKEALNLTRVVLIVMVLMMVILGGLDRLFTEIFKWLVSL